MLVLAGLGNPGAGYAGHRHNMGFMAVDAVAALYRFAAWRKKFQGDMAEGEIAGTRILLLKPMTYMNLSGQSVSAALAFYKLEPAALTVFHDEIDILLGRVKVKAGGGHGGHNGIRDIMAHIGPTSAACAWASATRARRRWCTITCCRISRSRSASWPARSSRRWPPKCRAWSPATRAAS